MKILIHTEEYYPTTAACAYRMRVFADVFSNVGNEVSVVTSSVKEDSCEFEMKERVIRVPVIKARKKTTLTRLLTDMSFAISSVIASLWVGDVDVVITSSPPPLISISGWLIAKLKRAKLVYDVRDIWPDVALEMNSFSESSIYCRVFRRITGFMYRKADLVTTVSPGKVEKIKSKLLKHQADKVRMVANGFDERILEFETNTALIQKYGILDKFTCVYIGNIGMAQGIDVLLRLAEETKHKDIQFLVFGTGVEKEKIEALAKRKKLEQLRFCGVIAHKDVATLLQASNISIIPLKNGNMKDSIPSKLYEALGMGCPVFLVAEGDACKVVDDAQLGCSVSPNNLEVIVQKFDDMVDNYMDYEHIRDSRGAYVRMRHSRQRITAEFEQMLHGMIK